jgi:hypothetical protein
MGMSSLALAPSNTSVLLANMESISFLILNAKQNRLGFHELAQKFPIFQPCTSEARDADGGGGTGLGGVCPPVLGAIPTRDEAVHARERRAMTISAPIFFFAQQREIIDEAFPGDIIGIPNHGTLRVDDTLTEGEILKFEGLPNFAPEILRRVSLDDAMRAKRLHRALDDMAEEDAMGQRRGYCIHRR